MNKLIENAWQLPWTINDAPHGLLDIIRGCNISCAACYNMEKTKYKSLVEIQNELSKILSLRKISTIAIIGGEPLLHPYLLDIIKFLKSKKLKVELFSNGLLLNDSKCKELANAGMDLIFCHIDFGQKRSDLPENCTMAELNKLRTEKVKLIKKYGMEAGMSITLSKKSLDNFITHVNYFIDSPYINYFLVTLYRNVQSFGKLYGELPNELYCNYKDYDKSDEIDINEIIDMLNNKENMHPYCYIPGRHNKDNPRWVSYVTATSFKNGMIADKIQMNISDFEKKYLKKYKAQKGVYPFFNKQNCVINSAQLIFNGLSSKKYENIKFVIKNLNNIKLMKRLLIQSPATILSNGKIEHCDCCPDLTIHKGKIVPVCICDNFE